MADARQEGVVSIRRLPTIKLALSIMFVISVGFLIVALSTVLVSFPSHHFVREISIFCAIIIASLVGWGFTLVRKQERTLLHESLVQSIFDNMTDGVFAFDENGKNIFMNALAKRWSPVSHVDIDQWHDYFQSEDSDPPSVHSEFPIFRSLRGQTIINQRIVYKAGTNERRTLLMSSFPLRIGGGNKYGAVCFFHDISETARLKHVLHEQEEKYRLIAQNSLDLIFITDVNGKYLFVSDSHEKVLGYSPFELESRIAFDLQHPQDRVHAERRYHQMIASKSPRKGEIRFLHKDGRWVYIETQGMPVLGSDGEVKSIVTVARDTTMRKAAEAKIHHMAYHDALTDLPNRRLFQEMVLTAMERAEASGKFLAIMFLDVNRLKEINDTLGHFVGDALLVEIALRLNHLMNSGKTLARIGGDEFTILLDALASKSEGQTFANRLIQEFSVPFSVQGHTIYVGCSVGVSYYPDDGEDLTSLLKNADTAMYRAKELGESAFITYDKNFHIQAFERLNLKNDLHKALTDEELVLHYQPIFNVRSRQLVAAEVLLRWQHPQLGLLPPGKFIHLAEENGLINEIGIWVLNRACRQMNVWRNDGYEEIRLSVNVSAHQFHTQDLERAIRTILQTSGIRPQCLDLEITETVLLKNEERVYRTITALKNMGIRISLDDFGTGYSSLGYLARFPIDTLKIDRTFIEGLSLSADHSTITSAIVALAHNLGMNVIAEGVETTEQLEFLQHVNCDEVQGFLLGKPMAETELEKLLKRA